MFIFARCNKTEHEWRREDQGELFSYAVACGEELTDFAERYLYSKVRFDLDVNANGYSEYTVPELYRAFGGKIKQVSFKDENAIWLGELYEDLHWYGNALSEAIVGAVKPGYLLENKEDFQKMDREELISFLLAKPGYKVVEWSEEKWLKQVAYVDKLQWEYMKYVGNCAFEL